MKKLLATFSLLLAALLLPIGVNAIAEEETLDSELTTTEEKETVIEEEEDVTEGAVYDLGEDKINFNDIVVISEDIEGDLITGGSTVTVNGDIGGDLLVMAGTATISGNIGGNVIAFVGQLTIEGDIGGKLVFGGGSATINSDVTGDVYMGAGIVNLNGTFGDDVRVGVGQLMLNGTVVGDLTASVGEYEKTDESVVTGSESIVYEENVPKTKVDLDTSGIESTMKDIASQFTMVRIFTRTLKIIGWVLVAMLVVAIMPVKTEEVLKKLNKGENWMVGFGVGLVVLIVAPILGLILAVSVIGIPIAMLGVVGLIFIGFISGVIMKIWVGHQTLKLLGQEMPDYYLACIVGVVIVELISFIPCLGGLIKCALMLVALGAFIMMKWNVFKIAKKK